MKCRIEPHTITSKVGVLSTKRFELLAQTGVVLAGLRCAIAGRNLAVGSDGLAYLDVARAYLRHDWSLAVNGYWGPLYPWLLAVALRILHPSDAYEFATVQAVNFLIFLLCLYAFHKFWYSVADWNRQHKGDGTSLPDAYPLGWLFLGYTLFLVKVTWFVNAVAPDVLVASVVLLIANQVLEIDRCKRVTDYVVLGLLLALGFYAKAILFYFGFFTLLAVTIRDFRLRNYRGPIFAGLICTLLISPYVVALSRTLGHFTVGETGRLNYAWFVDGAETGGWPDGRASFPFFPGPAVVDTPRVFLIPRLEGATYAPWYDAARFDRHSRAVFNIRGEIRQLLTNLKVLKEELIVTHCALLVSLIILVSGAPRVFFRRFATAWMCAVPAVMIIGMYLLVHLVDRFMIGFLFVLWGITFSCVFVPVNSESLARRALLAGILVFAAYSLPGIVHYLFLPAENQIERDLLIAKAIAEHGIRAGDAVALIGDGQTAYWAHWARASVAAEISSLDSPVFWSASFESQWSAVRSMRALGAKAVIWRRDSDRPCPQGWTELPQNSGCIIALNPPDLARTSEAAANHR